MVSVMLWVLGNGVVDTLLHYFLLSSRYSFETTFSGIVYIEKLYDCIEGICFNL